MVFVKEQGLSRTTERPEREFADECSEVPQVAARQPTDVNAWYGVYLTGL